MKLYCYTNVGNVRDNNEDGLLVENTVILASMNEVKLLENDYTKLVVADGMGGSKEGELATKALLDNIAHSELNTQEDLALIIEKTQKDLKGMDAGCATAGLCMGVNSFVFNVGDCRVYKKQDIFLSRMTSDHSLVQKLIDAGEITEEDAIVHPKKNVITSAIVPEGQVEIYVKKISVFEGDIFLICSDGLWGEFGIDELEECFEDDDIDEINDKLQQALLNKKLADNVSYILLKV